MKTISKSKEYRVHPEDLDVRGWNLVIDDVKVGTVNDLVLDDDRLRVKYLDVVRKGRGDEKDYHYLIPMNEVIFDRNNKYVYLERNSRHFIDTYPRFTNEIPSDYEEKVRNYYTDTHREEYPGKTFVVHEKEAYQEGRLYEDRTHRDERRDEDKLSGDKKEALFGREYETIHPDNWEERTNMLEKQKQIKKLEFERDIALIDKELMKIKSRKR